MSSFALICALAAGCAASDGTTQPTGTVMSAPIAWDGVSAYAPAGMTVVPYAGQVPYAPAPPAAATLTPLALIARLTPAEQTAIITASQNNAQIMLFMLMLSSTPSVDVNDPRTTSGIALMVSLGLLTQDRATKVLNLAVASP